MIGPSPHSTPEPPPRANARQAAARPLGVRERALVEASARASVDYALSEMASRPESARRLALELSRLLTMDDLKILFGFKTDEPVVRLIREGTLQAVKIGKEWRSSWEHYHRAVERLFAHPTRPKRIRRKKHHG